MERILAQPSLSQAVTPLFNKKHLAGERALFCAWSLWPIAAEPRIGECVVSKSWTCHIYDTQWQSPAKISKCYYAVRSLEHFKNSTYMWIAIAALTCRFWLVLWLQIIPSPLSSLPMSAHGIKGVLILGGHSVLVVFKTSYQLQVLDNLRFLVW